MRPVPVRCDWRSGVFALLACFLAAAAHAADAVPRMEDLRGLRPDGRAVPVYQMDLQRDAFTFHFESGVFHFLSPVAGRTVGAVFLGEGSYRLEPQAPWERDLLARVAGLPEGAAGLTDSFSEMVLFFTDDTERELLLHAPLRQGEASARAADALAHWQQRETRELRVDLRLRLLRELLNRRLPLAGSFFALVDGARLAPALAGVDALGADALGLIRRAAGEGSFLQVADPRRNGLWYLSAEKDELGSPHPFLPPTEAEPLACRVNVRLDPPALATAAALRLRIRAAEVRALPIEVPPGELSLYAAREVDGLPAPTSLEVVTAAAGARGGALVIFPEPLSAGTEIVLRLGSQAPAGLEKVGIKDRLQPTSPGSWFPRLAAEVPVPTELIFDLPDFHQIAATGLHIGETPAQEGRQGSVWRSTRPAWNPGFIAGNLGSASTLPGLALTPSHPSYRPVLVLYQRIPNNSPSPSPFPPPTFPPPPQRTDQNGGGDSSPGRQALPLRRLSSWRTEPAADLVSEVASRFARRPSVGSFLGFQRQRAAATGASGAPGADPDAPFFSPLRPYLAELDRLSTWFGPFPYERATFLAWSGRTPSPGWNGLVAAPGLKLDADGQRGLGGKTYPVASVGLRDLARHWWGLSVRAASYRDQWIEEGLQEMAVALLLDEAAAHRHWKRVREEMLSPLPGMSVPRHRLGPLIAGERLTLVHPDAYPSLISRRGGHVFHMIRMLLRQPGADPDQRFILWLQDLASQYAGKTLSAASLELSLAKYLPDAARLARGGSFSWFFDQWVRGTEIPAYSSSLQVHPAGEGGWQVSGWIRQQGVPASFLGIVPVYLELEQGELLLFARVRIEGEATAEIHEIVTTPKTPRRALINALGDVLYRE